MKVVASFIKKYWPIFFFALFGFVTIFWFRGPFIIDTLDLAFPYDPKLYFDRLFWIWNSSNNLGFVDSRIFANLIPYGLYIYLIGLLGIPLYIGQWLFVYLCVTGAGLSMYYLSRALGFNMYVSVLAGLLYIMNPFAMTFIWPLRSLIILSYAFMPLAVGHFIALVSKKRITLQMTLVHALLLFILLSSSFSNPTVFVLYLTFIGIYALYKSIFEKRFTPIVLATITTSVFIALSSFWLVPFVSVITTEFENASMKIEGETDTKALLLSSKGVFDSFSLTGFWALSSDYKGDRYFPWYERFESFPGNVLQYLPFLGLLAYALFRKKGREKFFLLSIILLSFFMLTGIKTFFPGIKSYLFTELPGLGRAFRNLETKFTPLLLLAFLPAAAAGLVYLTRLSKKFKIGLVVLLILYFGYLMQPFLTGEVIISSGAVTPSARVEVPEYYHQARAWLDDKPGTYKLIGLPVSTVYFAAYNWPHGFVGTNPDRYLFGKPTLTNNTGENFLIPDLIGSQTFANKESLEKMKRIAGLASVKQIVLHNDTRWEYIDANKYWLPTSPSFFTKIQNESKHKKFGDLSFIKVDDEYFNTLLYLPNSIVTYSGAPRAAINTFVSSPFYSPESVLLERDFVLQKMAGRTARKHIDILWDGVFRNATTTSYENKQYYYFDTPRQAFVSSRLLDDHYIVSVKSFTPPLLNDTPQVTDEYSFRIPARNGTTVYIVINQFQTFALPRSTREELITTLSIEQNTPIEVSAYYTDQNLLTNGTFSQGFWNQRPEDCSVSEPGDAIFRQRLVQAEPSLGTSLELSSDSHLACVKKRTIQDNTISGDLQLFQTAYRTVGDSKGKFCIWDPAVEFCIRSGDLLQTDTWRVSNHVVRRLPYTSDLYVYLYADEGNTVLYDNVSLLNLLHATTTSFVFEKTGWLRLDIPSSSEQVEMQATAKTNLVANGSFEQGLWHETVQDCSESKSNNPKIVQSLITEASHGRASLLLESDNHIACASQNIDGYKPNTEYQISLDYKPVAGSLPRICVWEAALARCVVSASLTDSEPLANGWYRWTSDFVSYETANEAQIFLYADYQFEETKIQYDSIHIKELLFSPENYLVAYAQASSTVDTAPATIAFTKINPTLYEITISAQQEAVDIVFTESFHPRWHLYGIDGRELPRLLARMAGVGISDIPGLQHGKANGYANFWHINLAEACESLTCTKNSDGSTTIHLVLEFTLQRWFYMGAFVTSATLIIVIWHLLVSIRLRRRRKLRA